MENKLLSQSDIDAMVNSLSSKPDAPAAPAPAPAAPAKKAEATPAPAPAPAAAATAKPASPPPGDAPTKYAMKKASLRHPEREEDAEDEGEAIAALAAQNKSLQEKIARLEAKVQKLEQMEKVRSGVVAPVNPQDFQELNKKVEQLTELLQAMSLKLQGTLGYDIFHLFTCEKCGAKENVSSVYRCTSCGHETWLGWRTKH